MVELPITAHLLNSASLDSKSGGGYNILLPNTEGGL